MKNAPAPTKTQGAFFNEAEAYSTDRAAQFNGTDNPRELRAIALLLRRPSVPREVFDREVGCSNGPDLVARLRGMGLGKEHLPCTRIRFEDRDGNICRPGIYFLTPQGRRAVLLWLAKRRRTAP